MSLLFLLVCRIVNGLYWCHHPTLCGHACTSTCAAVGSIPVGSTLTYRAQDTLAECQSIASAFGISASMTNIGFACLEDSGGFHTELPIKLQEPLLCSRRSTCPRNHLRLMDDQFVPCNSTRRSRLSVCACQGNELLILLCSH